MNAAYSSVQALLAQGSEYLPDAHALRELYFVSKAQAISMPTISSPSIGYQSRVHLLPSMELRGYGRSGLDTGLQSRLSDDILEIKKRNERVNYVFNYGYLAAPREVERLNAYRH